MRDTKQDWMLTVAWLLHELHIPSHLAEEAERLYRLGYLPGMAARELRKYDGKEKA